MSGKPPTHALVARVATARDAPAVRALTCAGRTPRYAGMAQRLVRRCGSVLAGTVVEPPGFRCLLFERLAASADDHLVGVSAVQDGGNRVCDWIVMGIARPFHGGRVPDGRSFAIAIAEETARFARSAGYRRMVAQVHRDHRKSLHVVGRLGFGVVTALDAEYDLYAVDLVAEYHRRRALLSTAPL